MFMGLFYRVAVMVACEGLKAETDLFIEDKGPRNCPRSLCTWTKIPENQKGAMIKLPSRLFFML
jgi:hypothetical protein